MNCRSHSSLGERNVAATSGINVTDAGAGAFELLLWINIKNVQPERVRSDLYFGRALKQAGIEIPFPQLDIHIRFTPELGPANGLPGDGQVMKRK